MTATLAIAAMIASLAQSAPTDAPGDSVMAYWRSLPEARPLLPGYRAPILGADAWPFAEPGAAPVRQTADLVAAKLAKDGLLRTVADAIEALGAARFVSGSGEGVDLLRSSGLPVDLLAFFDVEGSAARDGAQSKIAGAVAAIGRRIAGSTPKDELRGWLDRAEFRFIPSHAGFAAGTDSGEGDFGLMRLQLTRPDYWAGIGDGCSVDVARQLVEKVPDAKLLINIEKRFAEPFAMLTEAWPRRTPEQISIVTSALPVGQWARDNGVPGLVTDARTGESREASLAPRYASRGEDGTTFVPGESFVMDGLARTGHLVVQSPLLFQGGDLIVVNDAPRNRRVLLLGESEVWRNVALGLTAEQVLACFKKELGVDRCEVLPAASYHIDYQISVRSDAAGVTAFVNDPASAARTIVELGTRALARGGSIGEDALKQALGHVERGQAWAYAELIGPFLGGPSKVLGQYAESLTAGFATTPADSAIGNFQHYLSALDLWLSLTDLEAQRESVDPQTRAYLLARRRLIEDGERLIRQIGAMEWKITRIPSMGDSPRGINYLNGLHDRTRLLMPAHGGLYKPLDELALRTFQQALSPGVTVVPMLCAESQKRAGALRCSISSWQTFARVSNTSKAQ